MAGYTEVEAINFVLVRGNEPPITSLTTDSSSASTLAKSFLDQERLTVLSEGLQFNTRRTTFYPDINGHIGIGDNILSVDGYGANLYDSYTIVDDRLYDTADQTDVFTDGVELEVIYRYDFSDIPRWVQYRIMTRVAFTFMSQFAPDPNQLADMADLMKMALVRCNEKELISRDVNMVTKSPLGRVSRSGLYRRIGRAP